jgi:hypothetical protein
MQREKESERRIYAYFPGYNMKRVINIPGTKNLLKAFA